MSIRLKPDTMLRDMSIRLKPDTTISVEVVSAFRRMHKNQNTRRATVAVMKQTMKASASGINAPIVAHFALRVSL